MHDRCSQLCSYDLSFQNLLSREDGSISGLPGAIAYISVYAARPTNAPHRGLRL
jgi:hypothetical protein